MASSFIQRTFTAGDREKFTISVWVKRGTLTTGYPTIFQGRDGSDSYSGEIKFTSSDTIQFSSWSPSSYDGGILITNRKFRDTSAWYHIVGIVDTANVTSGDRVQLWVNGVRETSFGTETYPSSGADWYINKAGAVNSIGTHASETGTNSFDGLMSHMHFYDGYAYTASDFGSFDSTSGIWKIKTSGPSATYGTNGFFMKFEDSSNLDLDSSSNALTFTTTGTLTATKDNPSNNFCTMNPLEYMGNSSPTWSNGNTTYIQGGASKYFPASGTIALSTGKWYWEMQTTDGAKNGSLLGIAGDAGIETNMMGSGNNVLGYSDQQWAISAIGSGYRNNNGYTAYGVGFYGNVIIGCYLDLDNNKLYFASGGTIMQSGTGISITAAASTDAGFYVPASTYWGGSDTFQFNFGNGYLGTTAVTSAVADEGGEGAFEYDPSDGGASSFDGSAKNFRAICTKNIKAYGG